MLSCIALYGVTLFSGRCSLGLSVKKSQRKHAVQNLQVQDDVKAGWEAPGSLEGWEGKRRNVNSTTNTAPSNPPCLAMPALHPVPQEEARATRGNVTD